MQRVGGFWGALSLVALLALLTLGACGQDARPATAVAISVKTDLQLEQELRTVKIRVYAADAPVGPATLLYEAPPQPASELSRPLVLTPEGRDAMVVAVQGLDASGSPVIETYVRARFVDGRTSVVPVFLARSCLQQACDAAAGQTCNGDGVIGACGCGPIPTSAGFAVTDPGDVAGSYHPKACEAAPVCTPEPAMPGSTCNLTKQCGCAIGERCVAKAEGDRVIAICDASRGDLIDGQVCESQLACAAGYSCIGTPESTCRRYCETDADCGGALGSCGAITVATDGGVREAGYKTCFQRCTSHSQCQTGCCGSGGTCAAPDKCEMDAPEPMCLARGASCTRNSDCCGEAPFCARGSSGATQCFPAVETTNSCAAASGDDGCASCNKASCCAEMSACRQNRACQAFLNCLTRCDSDGTCESACERTEPSGAAAATRWNSCLNTRCASTCGG